MCSPQIYCSACIQVTTNCFRAFPRIRVGLIRVEHDALPRRLQSGIIKPMSTPDTLLELIGAAPADSTAIVLPEAGIRVTYKQLRDQVAAMADALAALGIRRGDRVSTVLPERIAGHRELPGGVGGGNGRAV